MPEVSVIIPVYNVEKFIGKCLESILAQSFKDFDIILIDDCSKDLSIDYAKNILELSDKKDAYTICRHQINKGLSASRNTGLDIAKGHYILFVDSDDFIEPTMINDLYVAIKEYHVSMATCNINRAYLMDGKIGAVELFWPSPFKGKVKSMDVLDSLLKCEEPAFVWRHLFLRTIISDIRFIEGVTMEDMFFLPYVLRNITTVAFVDKALYNYVERPGSIVKSFQPRVKEVPVYLEKMRQDFDHINKDFDAKFLFFKTKTFTELVSMVALTAPTQRDAMKLFNYWKKNIRKKDMKLLISNGNTSSALWLAIFKTMPVLFYWWHNWRDHWNKKD